MVECMDGLPGVFFVGTALGMVISVLLKMWKRGKP